MPKYDLNKPAFGPGSEAVAAEPKTEDVPASESQPEKETAATPETPAAESTEPTAASEEAEEQKVPYSRFKKFHERAIQAERDAAEWRAKAEAQRTEPVQQRQENLDVPTWWSDLYGDSVESTKAYRIQAEQNEAFLRKTREEALAAVREEREQEQSRATENLAQIDAGLEDLTAFVGRDLTDKEQSEILDIVDDYTPKDDSGNYLGAMLPFEKAWEIYELKNQAAKAPRKQAREAVAGITSAPTEGETNLAADKDKAFNPLDWNAYKKRVG